MGAFCVWNKVPPLDFVWWDTIRCPSYREFGSPTLLEVKLWIESKGGPCQSTYPRLCEMHSFNLTYKLPGNEGLKYIVWLVKDAIGFPGDSVVKNPPAMQEMWVSCLAQEDSMEKRMTIHSSNLAWEIPWTEEPGSPWYHKSLTWLNK